MFWRYTAMAFLLVLVAFTKYGTAKSKLSLWIDEEQIANVLGVPWEIFIIQDGSVAPYLKEVGFDEAIPVIPSKLDTVNLTWEAGDEEFTYWFDDLKSLSVHLLYNPLLSIPANGVIPPEPKNFQMSIPCTGKGKGVSTLILGLQIFNRHGDPIKGSPIKLKLKKQCEAFVTTSLCNSDCRNGGRCNQYGQCECKQGFHGSYCQLAMCVPGCENNGTCISPEVCICPDGFYGKQCERALCVHPCQNGGRCVQPGVCWCTSGFYGEACGYSYCLTPCKNGGACIGPNKCKCPAGYTGDLCEKGFNNELERPRRSNKKNKKKKKRRKKKRRRSKRKKKRRGKKKNKSKKNDRSLLNKVKNFSRRRQRRREKRRKFV